MKWIKYSRYTGDDLGIDSEDLLRALSDYLLQSGFQDSYFFYEMGQQTLDELRQAIQQALEAGDLLDGEMQNQIEQLRQQGGMD